MMDFLTLPQGPLTLANVSVPGCLTGQDGDLIRRDVHVVDGQISDQPGTRVEMGGALVLPGFVDMHTHLDKGHIWARNPNPDGTFMGALSTVGTDRAAHWSAQDLRTRMDFSLRCAYAHGTRAIRTHLDSVPPQDDISWPVFAEMRAEWAGRIDLQAVCLIGVDGFSRDGAFRHTAELVKETGGVLGMVSYPVPNLRDQLTGFFQMAAEMGLSVDFHVDETMDPESQTLRTIAEVALEQGGFGGRIVAGHCCSLSTQDEGRAHETIVMVAEAGIGVVSLPMCNLYLQDRHAGRTPRNRGITLVHEMRAAGVPVAFASDNTRDPFYAFGDMDMIEVLREATRIGHLDHATPDWITSVTQTPAAICGFEPRTLAVGEPADLVICKARTWNELLARPQSDRIVLRGGVQIDRALPDYSELDDVMRVS